MENLLPGCAICVPKHGLYPRFKTRSNGTRKAERQSLILPRGPLLAVTPEVHCLDIVGMVISSRPSHSSWNQCDRARYPGNRGESIGYRKGCPCAAPILEFLRRRQRTTVATHSLCGNKPQILQISLHPAISQCVLIASGLQGD